jgi:hypothetical protein
MVRQFRMPGYPFVLLSTDLLQEGEDLHTFCSDVYHYGLAWTPSAIEQRIGRVEHLSAEVGLLDPTTAPPPAPKETGRSERAKKGQRAPKRDPRRAKVVEFPKGVGSSGWTRTSNPPVNSRMLCH